MTVVRTGKAGVGRREANAVIRVLGEGMGSRAPPVRCGRLHPRPRWSHVVAAGPRSSGPFSLPTGSGTPFLATRSRDFFNPPFTRVAPTLNR